jgi:hypothetical protein
VGEAEAQVPADRQHDHVGWEAEAGDGRAGAGSRTRAARSQPTLSRLEGGHRERNSALPFTTDRMGRAVILAVIPPGTTRKTGSDQTDGIVDLTSENDTRRDLLDAAEPTHNRSVAGSRPASPPSKATTSHGAADPSGMPGL